MTFEELRSGLEMLRESSITVVRRNDPGIFMVRVGTAHGRDHVVMVKRIVDGGREFACCLAPGYQVPKGESLPAKLAVELLRRNEQLPFCWYLSSEKDQPWLGVKSPPFPLDSTDLRTLANVIFTVASIADEFEAEIGRDHY